MKPNAISRAFFTPLLRATATMDDLTIGVSIGDVELQSPASASAKSAWTMSPEGKQMATFGRAAFMLSNQVDVPAQRET